MGGSTPTLPTLYPERMGVDSLTGMAQTTAIPISVMRDNGPMDLAVS